MTLRISVISPTTVRQWIWLRFRRDDALIESISNGGPVATDSTEQYELALILSQWRDDVVATSDARGSVIGRCHRCNHSDAVRLLRIVSVHVPVLDCVWFVRSPPLQQLQQWSSVAPRRWRTTPSPAMPCGASSRSSSPTRPTRQLRRSTRLPSWKRPSGCWLPETFLRQRWCWTTQLTVPMRSRDSQDKTDLVERWGKLMTQGPGDHVTRSAAVDDRPAVLDCHVSHGDSGDLRQSGEPSAAWGV